MEWRTPRQAKRRLEDAAMPSEQDQTLMLAKLRRLLSEGVPSSGSADSAGSAGASRPSTPLSSSSAASEAELLSQVRAWALERQTEKQSEEAARQQEAERTKVRLAEEETMQLANKYKIEEERTRQLALLTHLSQEVALKWLERQ